jgi:phosphate transport system substrate-binding protein
MKAMQLLGDLSLFDGENATVATDTGLVTFRAEGVMYDGADCPDLVEYVPSLRMTGAARMGDLL